MGPAIASAARAAAPAIGQAVVQGALIGVTALTALGVVAAGAAVSQKAVSGTRAAGQKVANIFRRTPTSPAATQAPPQGAPIAVNGSSVAAGPQPAAATAH